MTQEQYPIFITTRDRLECVLELVDWLEKVGQEEIYLVDNDSSYPPLLDWLNSTDHTVIRCANIGNTSPWVSGAIDEYASDRYFATTDPDIIPVDTCPHDVFEYFESILKSANHKTGPTKISFGLRLDDLPDHYKHKKLAISRHGRCQSDRCRVMGGKFFACANDAILALHRPGAAKSITGWRADDPYLARHTSWYDDLSNMNEELAYYMANVRRGGITNWSKQNLNIAG